MDEWQLLLIARTVFIVLGGIMLLFNPMTAIFAVIVALIWQLAMIEITLRRQHG